MKIQKKEKKRFQLSQAKKNVLKNSFCWCLQRALLSITTKTSSTIRWRENMQNINNDRNSRTQSNIFHVWKPQTRCSPLQSSLRCVSFFKTFHFLLWTNKKKTLHNDKQWTEIVALRLNIDRVSVWVLAFVEKVVERSRLHFPLQVTNFHRLKR